MRIARDVHDVVGNDLSAIAVQAGAGRTLVDADPEEARATFEQIAQMAREALAQTRAAVRGMRDAGDEDGAGAAPGLADLDTLFDAVRASGVDVRVLRAPARRRADGGRSQAATFRIVQEALTNVARYARPPRAAVSIHLTNGEAFIDVTDDGARRPGPVGHGSGIAGMRERAALAGGRLDAGPSPDGLGWRVHAVLPAPKIGAEPMTAIRVLLADDQAVVRRGLRTILEAEPDIEIVGEAADGVEAVALAHRRAADIVLMDIRMPRMDGLAATRLLAHPATGAPIDVLVVTTFDHDEVVFAALRAGAAGFLLKSAEPDALVAAVRTVARGQGLISPEVTRRLITEFAASAPQPHADPRIDALTPREREVLMLMARGLSNADLGRELVLEPSTVKKHVANVLSKLDLRSRAQAVVFAYEHGLARPGS